MTEPEEPRGLSASIVCFACGRTLPDEPSYELLEQEDPCSACTDRLLHSLPPVLQMSPRTEADREAEREALPSEPDSRS